MTIIDNAVYSDGRRVAQPDTLAGTYGLLRERAGFAWIGLYRPSADEFASLATEFELHPLSGLPQLA